MTQTKVELELGDLAVECNTAGCETQWMDHFLITGVAMHAEATLEEREEKVLIRLSKIRFLLSYLMIMSSNYFLLHAVTDSEHSTFTMHLTQPHAPLPPAPPGVIDSEGYAICPECGECKNCSKGGIQSLIHNHMGSEACVTAKLKRDKEGRKKKDGSLLNFFKKGC
ncbi:hypothetical protein BDQ17DRAFT_1334627 [Cyathus striatus]|nr:hypothetical protein BDQ17DRAFT_1334627 [Cyathus striatus]